MEKCKQYILPEKAVWIQTQMYLFAFFPKMLHTVYIVLHLTFFINFLEIIPHHCAYLLKLVLAHKMEDSKYQCLAKLGIGFSFTNEVQR